MDGAHTLTFIEIARPYAAEFGKARRSARAAMESAQRDYEAAKVEQHGESVRGEASQESLDLVRLGEGVWLQAKTLARTIKPFGGASADDILPLLIEALDLPYEANAVVTAAAALGDA